MKITVTAPCRNEIRFIRAWIQNLRHWGADQVIVSEGGSTDGTRGILDAAQSAYGKDWLIILDHTQPRDAQRANDFNEGVRRQAMNEMVTTGLQVLLDVDEMLPDNARGVLESQLLLGEGGCFLLKQFWRSPNYIRVATEADPHWGPIWKHCCFPAGMMYWDARGTHCQMVSSVPMRNLDIVKFHYHYLYGMPKTFENRIAEFAGILSSTWDIRLQAVRVKHPKAFAMLEEQARFVEMMI